MRRSAATVVIDCFRGSVRRFASGYAIVAVDVIRATTTAITGVALGRRCFPEPTVAAALRRAAHLERALLVGEVGGNMPTGFDLTNSPAALASRTDVERPMVLVSSSGTTLLHQAQACGPVYLACFRNARAFAPWITGRHPRVAVLGAASRGEFREEDQMCCAQIAAQLLEAGYEPEDAVTEDLITRWRDAPADAWLESNSVAYLRQTGALKDLAFIREHTDDLSTVFPLRSGEVVAA
jgi:2-phosphosulfolactate phosphatase